MGHRVDLPKSMPNGRELVAKRAQARRVKCDEPFSPRMHHPNQGGYEMMPSIIDVLDRHLSCFGERDVEGVLADYSSDAVFFSPAGPLKGPDVNKLLSNARFRVYKAGLLVHDAAALN
jgi:hypothetical protein